MVHPIQLSIYLFIYFILFYFIFLQESKICLWTSFWYCRWGRIWCAGDRRWKELHSAQLCKFKMHNISGVSFILDAIFSYFGELNIVEVFKFNTSKQVFTAALLFCNSRFIDETKFCPSARGFVLIPLSKSWKWSLFATVAIPLGLFFILLFHTLESLIYSGWWKTCVLALQNTQIRCLD